MQLLVTKLLLHYSQKQLFVQLVRHINDVPLAFFAFVVQMQHLQLLANRRLFVGALGAAVLPAQPPEIIIDIHQHTPYSGRTADELVAHQRTMGITKTILLPAGRKYGLAADAGGNDVCVALCRRFPGDRKSVV